ncbi:MAG: tRNA uridine-5-carboxymethylaminomethyl(34) synthesis GTPase MnmE [Treponema sp.]|nr:tRNA uridine-5-carboxymethylaminomethyl(34) synthesis GTPase MnmE [Treponema sp.]
MRKKNGDLSGETLQSGAMYGGAIYSGAIYSDESPIAAFATVPGNSALSVIRCSGKGAVEMAALVFSAPERLKNTQGNTVIHGWITTNGEKIDEALVSVFRAPKSYTGEDSLDISCHGGAVTGKAVMNALKTTGFRDALPGEFTFRAFMNGKLDLTRSESVMELVAAKTDISRRHAIMRLSGSLYTEIDEIKKLIVQVLSGAEIYLDYSEDEISANFDTSASEEIAGRLPNKETALIALERLKKLQTSWQIERVYQEGVTVVIAGRPNVGKSSIFNSFLKEDRSIVTEIPGTTRDWIEAWVNIEGIPVRLVDTAGLRDTYDSVEKIGVERSLKILQEADIVLYLIDGEQGITAEDIEFMKRGEKHIFAWNKADISPVVSLPAEIADNVISISAKTGEGLNDLYTAIISAIMPESVSESMFGETVISVGTVRQKRLVDAACSSLEEALSLAENEEPLDLIAPLLREAVNALGEITGEISTADILEEMFSRFCVGK